MRGRVAIIIVVLAVTPLSWAPLAAQQKSAQSKKKESKAPAASLTGCVDQQEGQYVLIQEQTRSTIATLEAEGFESEGFAKYVGHKVTVRGTTSAGGTGRSTFKVRSVETLSDMCGPQGQ